MPRAGDTIEHPVTGERVRFLQTVADTGGELLRVEFWTKPGGFVAAEHVHPVREERFEIISGKFRYRRSGAEAAADDVLVIPRGVPHAWWNGGDDELRFTVEFRPALKTEEFFETYFGLAQDGKTSSKTGLPNPLRMAVLLREFEDEIRLARPPMSVQRVVFGTLAAAGRLLGYRERYPYPRAARRETNPVAK